MHFVIKLSYKAAFTLIYILIAYVLVYLLVFTFNIKTTQFTY